MIPVLLKFLQFFSGMVVLTTSIKSASSRHLLSSIGTSKTYHWQSTVSVIIGTKYSHSSQQEMSFFSIGEHKIMHLYTYIYIGTHIMLPAVSKTK